jgi:MinD superfamily P-loop ATPase
MRIAFASGKGGTGKTTVAVNLAYFLAYSQQQVQYLDCDVEEPNGHIFLKPVIEEKVPLKVMVPVIDQARCTSCGECSAKCQFNALVVLPGNTLVFPELCHSCGLCVEVCPEKAIAEGHRKVGVVERGKAIRNIDFVRGVLNVGEPMAGPMIQEVQGYSRDDYTQIIDAPPGTSCPVVKAVSHADCVVLVTEPTPFGLHDLAIAVTVARTMKKPVGVVINRERGEYKPLASFLEKNGLPVLATIAEDREIARQYSLGNIILERLPLYLDEFMELSVGVGRLLGKTGWRE